MKKILLILLVLILVFSLSSMCFAATNDNITITDEQNAGSFVYPDTEGIPEGAAGITTKSGVSTSVTLAEEEIPKGLPRTGGIPEEAFYAVGAILIISALVISMKKSKTASK